MVEDKVREEVLYREALAMGLDNDTIVKRRMAQKMQFLAEDVAAAHEPSTAELKAWFDKNSNKFALPGRYSFRHLYFSPDKRGKHAQADASAALAKIAGQPEDSKLANKRGCTIRRTGKLDFGCRCCSIRRCLSFAKNKSHLFWCVRRNQSIGFVDQLFIGQIHQHSMVVEIKPDGGLLFGRGAHPASPPQRRLPRSLFAQ